MNVNLFKMYEEGRKEAEAKQCNIAIVSGNYYWVKLMSDDKHEPAIAINLFGMIYFQIFNCIAVPCYKANDYSECVFTDNKKNIARREKNRVS